MKKLNLLGQKFERLLVIADAGMVDERRSWLCKCDCGTIKVIKQEHLKRIRSATKSCGCLNDENRKQRAYKLYSVNIKYHPSVTTARNVWRCRYDDGISFEDFYRLSQLNCYYCNAKPNNKQNSAIYDYKASQYAKDNGEFIYNGLDRIDNTKTHTLDNVVTCCKWCNFSKRERTVEEFKEWLKKLYSISSYRFKT